MTNFYQEPSSFRDPSGTVFFKEEEIFRQINLEYKENYEFLMNSGLYQELIDSELLISHKEIDTTPFDEKNVYKIIKPIKIPFISYPYEWSFSQLKQAALTTLEIQKIAIKHRMILKDCSAYNIQFFQGKAILIDSLSFEKYEEGQFWNGYKQFCEHFLAPLSLMSHKDIRLGQLLRIYLNGIPLDLTSSILPIKTKTSFLLLSHIHAHAKSQRHYEDKDVKIKERKLRKNSLIGLVESLSSGIKKMNYKFEKTEWGAYYSDTNYSEIAFSEKEKIINHILEKIQPKEVWDLGGNVGIFSRLASNKGINTICFDIDPVAIEKNYLEVKEKNEKHILPLLLDLTNPAPGIGWENKERKSLINRGPTDTVFALALIHHLAIGNNLPLEKIANFFSNICENLIIEFVPKEDSQVKRLLRTREDIFDSYNLDEFKHVFSQMFEFVESFNIQDSKRTLHFLQKVK